MKRIKQIIIVFPVLLLFITNSSYSQTLIEDQNPNYMNSQVKYSNPSYTQYEGQTIQVNPEVVTPTKAEYKHEEKMAQINSRSSSNSFIQVQPIQPIRINPNLLIAGAAGYFIGTLTKH